MSNRLDLRYPAIRSQFPKYLAKERMESRSFLAWFLENYYRLDEIAAQDAICDGPDDKGIDGLYVDDNLETVDIFQSKLVRNARKTLGDTQLKEFVGSLTQFSSVTRIQGLAQSTGNVELRNLIESSGVAEKIEQGYSVRGVFVTNVKQNDSATHYLASQPNLVVYDAQKLEDSYVPMGRSAPISKPVTFDLYGYDVSEYHIGETKVVFAPLSATELVQLDGIASQQLFSWNVRQSLGRTKVNKAIAQSIEDQSEHKDFLLYHNGLTILCGSVNRFDDKISISGYKVVNGCQSLTTLYEHRSKVSNELRIFARLIELAPDSELAGKITYHTNNQNAISARDLQSNSVIQMRLQNEFRALYRGDVFYQIKRGEKSEAPHIIENEEAARILLAFDLQQPWSCHQPSKMFDDLHLNIFSRPEVNARRILVLNDIYQVVVKSKSGIEYESMAGYRLTSYFLLYLLRQALECDEIGKKFCQQPEAFLDEPQGRERISKCVDRVLGDIIIDLNAEIKDREAMNASVDYKRELKSLKAVRTLQRNIIPHYQKAVARGRALSFGKEWVESIGTD